MKLKLCINVHDISLYINCIYSPALKKWGLYWICLVLPSFCDCHSVTFQIKIFITIFLGTVRPKRLKLGTHVDSGQMYHVYRNQAAVSYSTLYFFIFLHSNFQTLKFFVTLFSGTVRPRRLKLGTYMDSGQMYRVYRNQAAAYSFLSFFFLYFSNIEIFRHTKWGMYRVYQSHAAALICLFIFSFLSLQFSSNENFRRSFLGNCEA